jgi:hypothetical protein
VTLLEHELGEMPDDALRRVAGSGTPTVAAAAQAELDSRPTSNRAAEGEAWIRKTFPLRPDPFA